MQKENGDIFDRLQPLIAAANSLEEIRHHCRTLHIYPLGQRKLFHSSAFFVRVDDQDLAFERCLTSFLKTLNYIGADEKFENQHQVRQAAA